MGFARSLALLLLFIISSSAASLQALDTSSVRDQTRRQSPWPAGDLQGEWHQQQRALLQNPDRPKVDLNGRKGAIENYIPPGYPLETHKVVTEDGFVLNLHRIPHGKQRHSQPGKRPVVLLVHGFSLSSVSFVLLNENESIGFILADAGFDVWMFNSRGNDFSPGNLHYSYREAEYWYFSVDECALIDLPASINHILGETGASKLQLLTHSQGGTLGFMMLADMPSMQQKVASVITMGAPVFMEFMRAPFLKNWADVRNDKTFYTGHLSLGQFLTSRRLWPFIRQCDNHFLSEFCANAIWHMFYGPSDQATPDDLEIIRNTWPASVSSRVISHWAQMISDKNLRLQKFDFGTECDNRERYYETCNQQRYGTLMPPEYNLAKVNVPVFMLQGSTDIMVVEEDSLEAQRRIPGSVRINYNAYSHMDFIWDRNARHAIDVVDLLYRFAPGTF